MRAKTRLQHKVVTANEQLLPLTEKQELWAFRHCLNHYAFRTKSGMTTCMDCGHQWSETREKTCRCPHCDTKLEIRNTLQRKYKDKSYYSILTTQDGLQVQRVFLLTAHYRKGKKADFYSMEVVRYWIDDNGKTEVTALRRTLGYYIDSFVFDNHIELRHDNNVYRRIADCKIYPYYSATIKLRRNGLRGSLSDIEPTKLIEALLQNSRAETMFKAGRKVDLNYFLQHPMYFDLYWNTYKIVMRNNYHISDISLWVDYIRLLERCGKDIRNAHYVCPLDLKAEHDRYQERVRVIQEREKREAEQKKAQENEEKFRELKGKFFGLSFTDGLIVVSVLESVDDYYKEGNALHHCVGQCEYYLKPKSLVFSARIDDKRIETVELSLENFKVLQSRGLCNQNTEYHDRIIQLVQKNARKIRKRMTA